MQSPFALLLATLVVGWYAMAQNAPAAQGTGSSLPDTPSAVAEQQKHIQKRQLLANDPYTPLSHKDKRNEWLRRTYAPSTFVSAAVSTVYAGVTDNILYCCGGPAWANQFGASVADVQARNFFGKFLFPTLLNQDPRYLPKRNGSFLGRSWYAATRVFVIRKDDGTSTFNSSEILAIAFSKALSNAYYPEYDRTWSHTSASILGAIQGDASGYLLNEFTPELKRIFHRHEPKQIRNLSRRLPGSKY
jgi:hypothetical protein